MASPLSADYTVRDPFKEIRDNPFGSADETEKEELSSGPVAAEKKWLYDQCALENEVRELRQEGADPLQTYKASWIDTLAMAVMTNDSFQKAAVNECHNPGLFDFTKARFAEEWLLSVYLKGFWDCFSATEESKAIRYLRQLVQEAHKRAMSTVEEVVAKHAPEVIASVHEDNNDPKNNPPPQASTVFVDRLLRAAKLQKDINCDRQKLYAAILQVPSLEDREPVGKTMNILRSKKTETSIIDDFGERALAVLHQQYKRPNLTSISGEQKLIEGVSARKADLEQVVGDDAEIEEQENQPPSTLAVANQKSKVDQDTDGLDPTPELDVLKTIVKLNYEAKVVWYPNFRIEGVDVYRVPKKIGHEYASESTGSTSVEGNPAAFQSGPNAAASRSAQDNTTPAELSLGTRPKAKVTARQYSGFRAGREKSNREWQEAMDRAEDIAPTIKTMSITIDSCVDYLKMSIPSGEQTSRYEEALKDLASMTQRSEVVSAAQDNAQFFIVFSLTQMFDNWWHCRSYLVMLREACKGHQAEMDAISGCETDLAMLLSVIRGAAPDPLPWLPVIDHVLRNLWRAIRSQLQDDMWIKDVFNELALFAHGTALCAFMTRCKIHNKDTSRLLNGWYPMMWDYDSRCANEDCRCLLPDPNKVDSVTVRGMLSFGTVEARVGSRSIRALVSENRWYAYPCLYTIAAYWSPTPELVTLIFWYSRIFHNTTCKGSRGKSSITSFA